MEYPIENLFNNNIQVGIIRLKVAALIICVDHKRIDGVEVPESETDPFYQQRPHSYLNIEPSGVLAGQVKKVEAALIASIVSRELTPIQVRADLNGAINSLETWLDTTDVQNWCDVRSIDLSESFEEYISYEIEIYGEAVEAWSNKRQEFESSNFAEKVDAQRAKLEDPEYVLSLLRENIVLRERARPLYMADKPLMNRERETLMTIIGVMLELLKTPKLGRDSDAAVIKEMLDNYGDKPGIKERTLQEKFPAAKRILMAK